MAAGIKMQSAYIDDCGEAWFLERQADEFYLEKL